MISSIPSSTPAITHYLTESPEDNYTSLNRRATLYTIASKTALIAAALIAATATAIVLMGITLTGAAPFGFLGAILAAPILMHLSGKWAEKSGTARALAQIEGDTATLLKEIELWDIAKIKSFLEVQNLSFLNVKEIKERLVLIARFALWNQKAAYSTHLALLHLDKNYPENFLEKVDSQCSQAQDADRLLYEIRNAGFTIFETEALPAILRSALMLQLIANPFQQLELSHIGRMTPKPMPYRLAERIFDQQDTYLEFFDASRKPMECQEIAALFSQGNAAAVRQRMFDV